jgi:hypothetical protein
MPAPGFGAKPAPARGRRRSVTGGRQGGGLMDRRRRQIPSDALALTIVHLFIYLNLRLFRTFLNATIVMPAASSQTRHILSHINVLLHCGSGRMPGETDLQAHHNAPRTKIKSLF